jgi:hypothetical protein
VIDIPHRFTAATTYDLPIGKGQMFLDRQSRSEPFWKLEPQTEGRLDSYLNPAAFSTAPAFTYGNAPRDIIRLAPGYANWDISLFQVVPDSRADIAAVPGSGAECIQHSAVLRSQYGVWKTRTWARLRSRRIIRDTSSLLDGYGSERVR